MSIDDDRFWTLIARSSEGGADGDNQVDRLIELLTELSEADILAFDRFVHERIRDAYRWDLWAVAYVMNGGCSDDGFDYFCGWLISRGKRHYESALAKPENAANGVDPDDAPFESEGIWYAAAYAWESVTGRDSDDYYAIAPKVERSLIGTPFDEDTVGADYPALAKRFWK